MRLASAMLLPGKLQLSGVCFEFFARTHSDFGPRLLSSIGANLCGIARIEVWRLTCSGEQSLLKLRRPFFNSVHLPAIKGTTEEARAADPCARSPGVAFTCSAAHCSNDWVAAQESILNPYIYSK